MKEGGCLVPASRLKAEGEDMRKDVSERIGVLARERLRQQRQTLAEREEEHWRHVCHLALAREEPLPDREAHRRKFYAQQKIGT